MNPSLPQAPLNVVDQHGQPRFGQFQGRVARIDWSNLAAPYQRSRWWRHFHHKRWQYLALASDELFCGLAVVDLGWTSAAFAYAFDHQQRREVASFSQSGMPGMRCRVGDAPGGECEFAFLRQRIHLHTDAAQQLHVQLNCAGFQIEAQLDMANGPPLMLAVGPVTGGSVHATQKSSGYPLSGHIKAGGRHYDLRAGVGSFDYSNGLLARHTCWRWASAHDLRMGFNLQAGYFGAQENILWLDGELIPLGAAQFDFDPGQPLQPWHIYTDDGLLDLYFQPLGARHENKNLLIAASRYVQPIGTFSGWVRAHRDAPLHQVSHLMGVTEDHDSRW